MALEAHVLRADVSTLEADLSAFLAARGITAANIVTLSVARSPVRKGRVVATVVADTGA